MLENLQLNQSVDTQDRGGAWQSTHRLRSCTGLAAAVGCGRNGVRMSLPTGRPAGARARMLAREEPRMCMHLAGRALPPPDALHDRHQVGLGLRQARTHTRRAVGTRRERSEVGGVSAPARTRSTRTPTRARRTPCCPTRREGLAGPIPGARRSAPECRPARAHSGLRLKRAPPATDARSERVERRASRPGCAAHPRGWRQPGPPVTCSTRQYSSSSRSRSPYSATLRVDSLPAGMLRAPAGLGPGRRSPGGPSCGTARNFSSWAFSVRYTSRGARR